MGDNSASRQENSRESLADNRNRLKINGPYGSQSASLDPWEPLFDRHRTDGKGQSSGVARRKIDFGPLLRRARHTLASQPLPKSGWPNIADHLQARRCSRSGSLNCRDWNQIYRLP